MKEKVIVIIGATASGKSSLGIELAKRIDGEIISCDSMQIYKKLDIGTAKVTIEEQEEVKHHLIDICDISDEFSVADFKTLCYDKIDEILDRHKTPILVGGTGLYVNSVVYDLDLKNEASDVEVKKYRDYLNSLDQETLYDMLKSIDPVSAQNIHKNNVRRVIRALEIAKFYDKTKSEHMSDEEKRIESLNSKYEFLIFYLDMPRELLYERINSRVDIMFSNEKMLDEARLLYDNRDSISNTCRQAIAYKELFPYFEGDDTLENCKNTLKQATRNYAKRQITWFKNKIKKIDLDARKDTDENVSIIVNYINN